MNWSAIGYTVGYGLGAWVGFNIAVVGAVVGAVHLGLRRIDRLAAELEPAPGGLDWALWEEEFDRPAAEKDEVW